MNNIFVNVIKDSISPLGIRLPSIHLHYPRVILPEVNTHRVFSKNTGSTRAIPTKKLIQRVRENPYIPVKWGVNKPGMVSEEVADEATAAEMLSNWLQAANSAADQAEKLFELGLHKQWAGRILEPFLYVDQLITSTDWANFFELRDEKGAQPEMDILAKAIRVALDNSTPTLLQPGEWHLPYIDYEEDYEAALEWHQACKTHRTMDMSCEDAVNLLLRKISVARCARLTIEPFDGDGSIEKELKRYELLMVSRPVHASPAEHQATPDTCSPWTYKGKIDWSHPEEHGNFHGWRQFRKQIPFNTTYDR